MSSNHPAIKEESGMKRIQLSQTLLMHLEVNYCSGFGSFQRKMLNRQMTRYGRDKRASLKATSTSLEFLLENGTKLVHVLIY